MPGHAFVNGEVLTDTDVNTYLANADGLPKNLIHNGAMQVAQRGTSVASITTAGYYTADRWYFANTTLGTWTQSIENDAPTGSGLRKSWKVLCTTADASPAAGDLVECIQMFEGQDLQRICKGTASAKPLTVSFWVKANVTGTYVVGLYDNDNTRVVSATYTISASVTWEFKTVTFPADTTGALDNDNAFSIQLQFGLGAGSTFTSGTLNTTWAAFTTGNFMVGQTNVAAATNNYWQVTGVQLETGSIATPFEFRPFGDELRTCQRYFYMHVSGATKSVGTGYMYSATQMNCQVKFPTTMRATPGISASSGTDYFAFGRNSASDTFNSLTINQPHENGCEVYNSTEISGTAGQAGGVNTNNAAAYLGFSADL
jgi:hypothetical protein